MDYISILNEKLGAEEAEAKIKERVEGFHGLLTREAAAKLIASEMELIGREVMKAAELKEGMGSVDLEAEIVEIGNLKSFPSGAVLRTLVIADSSGEASVNFWGDDAKKAGLMHLGDVLEIKKGYVKMGRVNIGYKSIYSVVKRAEAVPLSGIKEGKGIMCMGKVSEIIGRKGNAFLFEVSDGGKSIPVSVVNNPEKGEHLQVGDSVLLEGVEFNGGELIVGGRARMLLRKNRDNIFRGKLEGIELKGGEAMLDVGGEKFAIGKSALIKFLKLKDLKEDIDLRMVAEMKIPEVKGRDVLVVFRKTDGGKEAEQAELR